MDIVYIFDENYACYAGVSIESLLYNNQHLDDIHIHAVVTAVSEDNVDKLKRTVARYGRELSIIDATDVENRLCELQVPEYNGSRATYYRLFFSELLPELDRILYTDCDTIVSGRIDGLIGHDLEGHTIAMAYDSNNHVSKVKHGFGKDDEYYCAGIMLVDLKRWRETDCQSRFLECLNDMDESYVLPDQDILNRVFSGDVSLLAPEYNLQTIHFAFDPEIYYSYFRDCIYYPKEAIDSAVDDPRIIHCLRFLGQRPWHKDSMHPNAPDFNRYLEMSEWRDFKRPESDAKLIFKIERILYRILPTKLFFYLFYKIQE